MSQQGGKPETLQNNFISWQPLCFFDNFKMALEHVMLFTSMFLTNCLFHVSEMKRIGLILRNVVVLCHTL